MDVAGADTKVDGAWMGYGEGEAMVGEMGHDGCKREMGSGVDVARKPTSGKQ